MLSLQRSAPQPAIGVLEATDARAPPSPLPARRKPVGSCRLLPSLPSFSSGDLAWESRDPADPGEEAEAPALPFVVRGFDTSVAAVVVQLGFGEKSLKWLQGDAHLYLERERQDWIGSRRRGRKETHDGDDEDDDDGINPLQFSNQSIVRPPEHWSK